MYSTKQTLTNAYCFDSLHDAAATLKLKINEAIHIQLE